MTKVAPFSAEWSRHELEKIEKEAIKQGLARPEGQRLSNLAKRFLAAPDFPEHDPLRAGIHFFVKQRLRDPMLGRSPGGLIEHLKVASGARKGMQAFDHRADTGPNHAETIVLACEALALLEQRDGTASARRDLEWLLDPARNGFRSRKDDATLVQQIAAGAIHALQTVS
ncbi:MAG: hypothetical protein IT384_18275 [Deltaproteobacteria bacterium]|nr:hypothetical protein [Deltaproteobacteria bacterium]